MIKVDQCIPSDFFWSAGATERVRPRVAEGCCGTCRTKVAINLNGIQSLNLSETADGRMVVVKTCAVCGDSIAIPVSYRQ
jgi:hypothetical protein